MPGAERVGIECPVARGASPTQKEGRAGLRCFSSAVKIAITPRYEGRTRRSSPLHADVQSGGI